MELKEAEALTDKLRADVYEIERAISGDSPKWVKVFLKDTAKALLHSINSAKAT